MYTIRCERAVIEDQESNNNNRKTSGGAFHNFVSHLRNMRRGKNAVHCGADTSEAQCASTKKPSAIANKLIDFAVDKVVDTAVAAAFGEFPMMSMGMCSVKVHENPLREYAQCIEPISVSLFGSFHTVMTCKDLYWIRDIESKYGYFTFRGHTLPKDRKSVV